jgi:AraC-like DNA-binding protein
MARTGSQRLILLLHPDEGFQRLVRGSLSAGFGCWTLADWSALGEAARDAAPSTVAVVDPFLGSTDGGPAEALKDFLAQYPWFPVVATLPSGAPVDHLHTLCEWMVAEVVLRGVEDTADGIALAVRHAQGTVMQGLMDEVLPPYVTGRARRLLLAAAEAVAAGGHAPDLAALLGVTETTVMRRCERLHLPPPRRLLAWVRVLLAAKLLDQPGRTSQSVAYACGYSAEAALRRVVKEFLDVSVTELRKRGALRTAAGVFLKELRELRERGSEVGERPG